MAIDEQLVRRLLYDYAGGQRWTQDSPILPDVWLAFAADPVGCNDLILSPVRGGSAAKVARDLRKYLYRYRANAYTWPPLEGRTKLRPRLTSLPGRVTAMLYFDELMRIVLAMTPWWKPAEAKRRGSPDALRQTKGHPLFGFPDPEDTPDKGDAMTAALVAGLENVRKPGLDRSGSDDGEEGHARPRPDVLWVVRLAGAIALSCDPEPMTPEDFPTRLDEYLKPPPAGETEEDAEKREARCLEMSELLAGRFLDLYRSWPVDTPPPERRLWTVHLNRTAEAAVYESALTIKADAARLLFEISCDEITWAVIDSGIHREHPAFKDHREGGTRVRLTLDFTNLRDLLDPEILAARAAGEDRICGEPVTVTKEVAAYRKELVESLLQRRLAADRDSERSREDVREELESDLAELRKRICKGQDIDWEILEDFIIDREPEMPRSEHGTHVAGILGADWRDENDPTRSIMRGICPDIKLVDVRVLREDGMSDEFEVMAAVQYLRYRNSTAGFMDVHGANLSLSLRHDVANYACGSTPICEECAEAVALGMVIVAAAGNRGFVQYQTPDGFQEGYNTVSVTDPGNAEAVITVGATHRKRPHEYGVSYFSSRGPTGDGRAKPDLVAPGEKIKAPIPGGGSGFKDGTSMAAPHVSGAAAMLMARHKELVARPAQIKRILCDTATDLGRERYFQGHGLLDILRALQSI